MVGKLRTEAPSTSRSFFAELRLLQVFAKSGSEFLFTVGHRSLTVRPSDRTPSYKRCSVVARCASLEFHTVQSIDRLE